MCLSIPGKVLSIEKMNAKVDVNGLTTKVDISLLENVQPEDYVLIHTGFAIQKYDQKEAEETLRLLNEALKTDEI